MSPANNPPVTAASIVAAVNLLCVALGVSQDWQAFIVAVSGIVAAFVASRFTTPAKWV